MWKKQVLQDPGYIEGVESACCMLHAMLQGCMVVCKESKKIQNTHNTVDLRHLSLMLKESKVHSIYNVDSSPKSSYYIKI